MTNSTFSKNQRIAWAILLVTGAVTPDDLLKLGITKKASETWRDSLLERKISFEQALEAVNENSSDLAINYLLALCLDKRYYTKQSRPKADVSKSDGQT